MDRLWAYAILQNNCCHDPYILAKAVAISMQSLETFRIELPARYKYLLVVSASIEAILSRLEGFDIGADTIYQLQLAAHELCNNVIEHAYGDEAVSYTHLDVYKRQRIR